MSPAPEFRYVLDEDYLETRYQRGIASLPLSKRLLRWVLGPLLAVVVIGVYGFYYRGEPTFLLFMLVGCPVLYRIEFLRARKRRREQYYQTDLEDAPVRVSFDEQGIETEVADSRMRVSWTALARAYAFDDGWMLGAPSDLRWLPRRGLKGATPEEFEEWLRQRIGEYVRIS